MYKNAEISIAGSMAEVEDLTKQMLGGNLPVFQVGEDVATDIGCLVILDTTQNMVKSKLGIPFSYNTGPEQLKFDEPIFGRTRSGGPHFHYDYTGITIHKETVGTAVVEAAYRGRYDPVRLMDSLEEGEEYYDPPVDSTTSIGSLKGLDGPVFRGRTVPGRLTVLSETTYRQRRGPLGKVLGRKKVLDGTVHDFIRRGQTTGSFVALSCFRPEWVSNPKPNEKLINQFVVA